MIEICVFIILFCATVLACIVADHINPNKLRTRKLPLHVRPRTEQKSARPRHALDK
jgi:hypothetical protein